MAAQIVSHEYHRVDPQLVWEAVLALDPIRAMVDAELIDESKGA